MSDSVWAHRQQPTRLPRPWDSPGKNTGVGGHFLAHAQQKVTLEVRLSRAIQATHPRPQGRGVGWVTPQGWPSRTGSFTSWSALGHVTCPFHSLQSWLQSKTRTLSSDCYQGDLPHCFNCFFMCTTDETFLRLDHFFFFLKKHDVFLKLFIEVSFCYTGKWISYIYMSTHF